MPTTRSASRQLSNAASLLSSATAAPKRKASNAAKESARQSVKKPRTLSKQEGGQAESPQKKLVSKPVSSNGQLPVLLPAKLSFSFEHAKKQLIDADPRFEDLFQRLPCRPFEHLEQVDPFRTLVTSILGQQISWLAARSITHRFIRLFDESLPEKPIVDEQGRTQPIIFFPNAHQVASLDVTTLRTAGLSGRKAEYVQDLASRFADGRLSAQKILEAEDEDLYNMLIEVRGIGRWTVDMFAIFSLRRPDILPIGDLGVQRGMLRWFLSLHSPKHSFAIEPKKLPKAPTEEPESEPVEAEFLAPVEISPENGAQPSAGMSSVPPAPAALAPPATPVKKRGGLKDAADEDAEGESDTGGLAALPPPFTPSINKTLNKEISANNAPRALPQGLTVGALQSRLESKKKIKGAFLTPQEMTDLAASWQPYRSLGVYYMWALAEEK